MSARPATADRNEPLQSAAESLRPQLGRIVIIADDYQFLDTTHVGGPASPHEWVIPRSREHFVELTEPPPVAVVVDLGARSLDPIEILYLLGALSLKTKVVLLSGADAKMLANARSIGATVSLDIAGTLPRPLAMDALLRLLAQHAQAEVTIGAEELELALLEQQFLLHYQPIAARIAGGWTMRAVEALVRWQHPRHGLLYPGQFLGAVRSARLMTALTDFVMTEAIQQAGQWQRQNLDLAIAVNLEPRLVRDVGFAERLVRLLHQHGVPPHRFGLEVIESASARDREFLAHAMDEVRAQGIGLSLDDFGTGNSSLMELHRLPFTELKIDRSLIHEVVRSPKAATIVKGTIDLAHRLSLRVCAEGVETADTFAFLDSAGCDAMQGVFIAKPASAAAVETLQLELRAPVTPPPA